MSLYNELLLRNFCKKKKKKTVIYLISGIIIVAIIGTITYLVWSKNKSVENQKSTNSKTKIQKLQTELNSLKSKLDNISDATQKSRLENKLSNIENQLKNLSGQNNSPSTIEKLEQEIKEFKKKLEEDEPEPDNNSKKKEIKVRFVIEAPNEKGEMDYCFNNFLEPGEREVKYFYISKNHPQIKILLSQGKLQESKKFIIRYKKIDKHKSDITYHFNENNQDLEIIEVKEPSPAPNPNPQPDKNNKKGFNFVSTKINDNTYKYKIALDVNGSEIDFANFIIFLKTKDEHFFQAFQGALKDANSKFPAYFWKCPPVSEKTLGKTFEFVVIKSESLNNITQNYSSFQEHFGKSNDNQVVSFLGFGGSTLISPVPKGTADYKNISQFTKNAPDEQQQALWKEVVDSLMKELKKDSDTPRWLNTEGIGVSYLHVRIDKTARFYSNYKEYEKWN